VGLAATPQGDDVDDERVVGTGQTKKAGVFRGDIRCTGEKNEGNGETTEKRLMSAVEHLQPHERLFPGIGKQNVILTAQTRRPKGSWMTFSPLTVLFFGSVISRVFIDSFFPRGVSKGYATAEKAP